MVDVAQLCTVDDVKSRIGITTTNQDALIQTLIDTVLAVFNQRYSREFMPQVSEARTFRTRGRFIVCESYDFRSVASVVLNPGQEDEKILVSGIDYTQDIDAYDNVTKTYSTIVLSRGLLTTSANSVRFGYSIATVTAEWGCWADVADVPRDVRSAAIETVLAWMAKPAANITAMLSSSEPRDNMPPTPQTWDIPSSAYQKMRQYDRSGLGVW